MRLPLGRRVTCDFLQASKSLPTVAVQKPMNLADVVAARNAVAVRPSWCSIFTKAYGKVVAARPDLRRAYLSFPWERMYEYASATADVIVEAEVDGELSLVNVPLKQPEAQPLLGIDQRLAWCKDDPIARVGGYRQARRMARLPRIFRRAVWWTILNASGYQRSRFVGAFAVTTVGKWGVESLRPISPWITLLHYGMIDPDGNLTVRLTYDHRVLDGLGPATALVEMEQILKTDIVAELRTLGGESPKQFEPAAA